jgi:hypothetical protein
LVGQQPQPYRHRARLRRKMKLPRLRIAASWCCRPPSPFAGGRARPGCFCSCRCWRG